MASSNPTMSEKIFSNVETAMEGQAMTVQGAVNKSFALLGMVLITAGVTWSVGNAAGPDHAAAAVMPWMIGGMIASFIIALITAFKPRFAPVTAPLYALAAGAMIGGISMVMEMRFPGIVLPAVGLTFATFMGMLIAYTARLITVTEKFRAGVIMATFAVMIVYLISFIARLAFGTTVFPFIHEGGMIGIGFSLFVVGLAAVNLLLDFDMIERGAQDNAPRYMEWYCAFGLVVTLVWLYIEILRLLSKLRK